MAYLFEPRNSSFEITIDSFNNLLNFWKGDGNQQKGIALKSIKEILNQSPVLSILTEIIWLFVESNVFAVCRWRCLLFIISTTQTHETSEMGQNILGHTNSKAFKKREKKILLQLMDDSLWGKMLHLCMKWKRLCKYLKLLLNLQFVCLAHFYQSLNQNNVWRIHFCD